MTVQYITSTCAATCCHPTSHFPSLGDSGVGKTVILENLLKQLGQEGGASTKGGTVLGKVFHPADKNQALLSSISTLTKVGGDDSDGGFLNPPFGPFLVPSAHDY